MKRVVKFFLDSSLELEELDSPPLVGLLVGRV
jgi:hypothetical protein